MSTRDSSPKQTRAEPKTPTSKPKAKAAASAVRREGAPSRRPVHDLGRIPVFPVANAAPRIVQEVFRWQGQPLDVRSRALMETRFGHDFSAVRVHADARAANAASSIVARAFTLGRNLVFGAGQYDPLSGRGHNLLAHELTHVVQGPRDVRLDGARGIEIARPDHRAEREANRIAEFGGRPLYRSRHPLIFRQVTPIPVARQTAIQIFGDPMALIPTPGMTLQEFKDYTTSQADWFVEPTLAAGTNRNDLWRLLLLTEEGSHILSGAGDLLVSELRTVSAADWVPLKAFCRGTDGSGDTVRIFRPFPPTLADRITLGRTLVGMEAVIPHAVLEVTVSDSQLIQVQTQALLPRLTTYWTDYQPHLEQSFTPTVGARGPEFERVLVFLNSLGAPGLVPLAPLRGATPDQRWVRNLHRFPLPMLLRLVTNLGDTSGSKRLILVLHTGHDAPAAFQVSAHLFSNLVLTSPNNLVLMIEGPTSLAAVTGRIPAITATWGKIVGGTRRLSQIVIAGHGSVDTAGLAGTGPGIVTDGEVSHPPEQSLRVGDPDTQALLDALLTHMHPATARILYAGCLVGSSHAAAGTPAAGIPAALAARQSLAQFTEARAAVAGIPAGRVRAARASVALGDVTSLFTAAGNLAPTYPADPNAFGSATTYTQSGREPEGVMRAAVEVGATNRVTAETLLRTRLAMAAAGGWYDDITRLLVTLALPPVVGAGVDLRRVNELANVAQVPFLAFWPQFRITPAHFVGRLNPQAFAADVYTGVAALGPYTNPVANQTERMRIIVDQGRIALTGAAELPNFLAGILATGLAANNFELFLDLAVIAPHGAALLPVAGPFTVERNRLALAWFSRDDLNADVRSFLTAQVLHPPNAPAAFTPAVSAEIAAAGQLDRTILDGLGFAPTAVGAGGLPLGNIALPGSATNTMVLTGRPYEAHVISAPNAMVRNGPSAAASGFMTLGTGGVVRVMGFTGGFAAVDAFGRLGFVSAADLTPPPP